MKDNPSGVAELFRKETRAPVRESEPEEGLPANGAPYAAFSRRSNKPEFSLHFLTAAGTMRSFQYAHLDSDSGFTAECITLRFMGMMPMKVVIDGRNLRQLYDYLHQHRVAWIREAARAYGTDGEPLVTKVTITPVKEDVVNSVEN